MGETQPTSDLIAVVNDRHQLLGWVRPKKKLVYNRNQKLIFATKVNVRGTVSTNKTFVKIVDEAVKQGIWTAPKKVDDEADS